LSRYRLFPRRLSYENHSTSPVMAANNAEGALLSKLKTISASIGRVGYALAYHQGAQELYSVEREREPPTAQEYINDKFVDIVEQEDGSRKVIAKRDIKKGLVLYSGYSFLYIMIFEEVMRDVVDTNYAVFKRGIGAMVDLLDKRDHLTPCYDHFSELYPRTQDDLLRWIDAHATSHRTNGPRIQFETPPSSMTLKFGCNSHIRFHDKEKMKAATISLYLIGSFFNHSCDPNLSVTRDEELMVLKAKRQINKGEELTWYYYDVNNKARPSYFVCNCKKCTN
jgi:hypothetical protein